MGHHSLSMGRHEHPMSLEAVSMSQTNIVWVVVHTLWVFHMFL